MISGYVLENWFTLKEVFVQFMEEQGREEFSNTDFYNLFKTYYPSAPIYEAGTTFFKDYINDLVNMVYDRFSTHYIVSSIDDEVVTSELKKQAVFKIIRIIVNTYPKYSQLMKYYGDLEDNLMKQIGSTTKATGRFNDTPQNGGDFSDDEHTSNITISESEVGVDGDTPIERLTEIKGKLVSIMYDWSNEFDKIFIEEGNI